MNDRTLAERAFTAIHERIVNGEYGPGHRLRIEQLAATLQISPTPIREALHRLQSLGLTEHIPHRGASVTDLNPMELCDLYESRLAVEPLAVAKAAQNFTPEHTNEARRFLAQLASAEKAGDFTQAWKAHTGFHFTIYRASKSDWMVRLITPMWERSQCYRLKLEPLKADLKRRTGEHQAILDACIAREPQLASTGMYNHLARTANAIAGDMKGGVLFPLKSVDSTEKKAV